MDFFDGPNWGTYNFFKFKADNLPFLRPIMEVGKDIGSIPILLIFFLVALGVLIFLKKYRLASWIFLAVFLGIGLVENLRHAIPSPRPPENPLNSLPKEELLQSFPSMPVFLTILVMVLWAKAMSQVWTAKQWLFSVYALAIVLTIWVCLSQLVLGLGFLSDVLAGISGGLGLAFLTSALGTDPSAEGSSFKDAAS